LEEENGNLRLERSDTGPEKPGESSSSPAAVNRRATNAALKNNTAGIGNGNQINISTFGGDPDMDDRFN
jgi:hypothetical protein